MARKSPTARKLASAAVERLCRLRIELPSWGFADTRSRFGKFHQPAAAITIEDKLDDAAWVHAFTGITPSVAVHVLWDFPEGFDPEGLHRRSRRPRPPPGAGGPGCG